MMLSDLLIFFEKAFHLQITSTLNYETLKQFIILYWRCKNINPYSQASQNDYKKGKFH